MRCTPAHIHQVGARRIAYGALRVGFSRTPSGLACRACVVWQCRRIPSLSGLLAALTGVPRIRLPPASSGRCDDLMVQVSHLHSNTQRLVAHHPVDALHLEHHMLGKDVSDTARYGHHGLRSDGRPVGQLTAKCGSYTGLVRQSRSHPVRPEPPENQPSHQHMPRRAGAKPR